MKENDVIISGVHMDLTEALKNNVRAKAEKLFRHEDKIMRIRVELEHHSNSTSADEFIAKGHIEINNKPMIISISSDDLYKSIDELMEKLDRKLRRRSRLERVKRKDVHEVDIGEGLPKVSMA